MKKAVVLHTWVEDEEDDDDVPLMVDLEAQKERIRQIIAHQKYLFRSSSSSCSSSDLSRTTSTSFSSQGSISLRELMKSSGMSLRRLFDAEQEHTTLATHTEEQDDSPNSACSPPSLVWESSDSDCEDGFANAMTTWSPVKRFRAATEGCRADSPISFPILGEFGSPRGFQLLRSEGKLLTRKRSYKTLPAAGGFGMWRCRWLGFRLRSPPRLSFRMRSRRRLKAVGDDSHLAMAAEIIM